MRIDIFTIFPDLIDSWLGASLIGKARRSGLLDLRVHDLRSAAFDPHRSVDDSPFGGGAGMVLAPESVFAAVEAVQPPRPLLLLAPGGRRFDQAMARELLAGSGRGSGTASGGGSVSGSATRSVSGSATSLDGGSVTGGVTGPGGPAGFSLLCGRYEGVDQRIADHLADGEVSIGDYVLAGGEVAALVIVEAVARLVPGVMGNLASADDESFSDGLLEYPQYTRPALFRGWEVPDVLRSGDHGRVARWRRAQALARTLARRPDLIDARGGLTADERRLLEEFDLMSYPFLPRGPDAQSAAPPVASEEPDAP